MAPGEARPGCRTVSWHRGWRRPGWRDRADGRAPPAMCWANPTVPGTTGGKHRGCSAGATFRYHRGHARHGGPVPPGQGPVWRTRLAARLSPVCLFIDRTVLHPVPGPAPPFVHGAPGGPRDRPFPRADVSPGALALLSRLPARSPRRRREPGVGVAPPLPGRRPRPFMQTRAGEDVICGQSGLGAVRSPPRRRVFKAPRGPRPRQTRVCARAGAGPLPVLPAPPPPSPPPRRSVRPGPFPSPRPGPPIPRSRAGEEDGNTLLP